MIHFQQRWECQTNQNGGRAVDWENCVEPHEISPTKISRKPHSTVSVGNKPYWNHWKWLVHWPQLMDSWCFTNHAAWTNESLYAFSPTHHDWNLVAICVDLVKLELYRQKAWLPSLVRATLSTIQPPSNAGKIYDNLLASTQPNSKNIVPPGAKRHPWPESGGEWWGNTWHGRCVISEHWVLQTRLESTFWERNDMK